MCFDTFDVFLCVWYIWWILMSSCALMCLDLRYSFDGFWCVLIWCVLICFDVLDVLDVFEFWCIRALDVFWFVIYFWCALMRSICPDVFDVFDCLLKISLFKPPSPEQSRFWQAPPLCGSVYSVTFGDWGTKPQPNLSPVLTGEQTNPTYFEITIGAGGGDNPMFSILCRLTSNVMLLFESASANRLPLRLMLRNGKSLKKGLAGRRCLVTRNSMHRHAQSGGSE